MGGVTYLGGVELLPQRLPSGRGRGRFVLAVFLIATLVGAVGILLLLGGDRQLKRGRPEGVGEPRRLLRRPCHAKLCL